MTSIAVEQIPARILTHILDNTSIKCDKMMIERNETCFNLYLDESYPDDDIDTVLSCLKKELIEPYISNFKVIVKGKIINDNIS